MQGRNDDRPRGPACGHWGRSVGLRQQQDGCPAVGRAESVGPAAPHTEPARRSVTTGMSALVSGEGGHGAEDVCMLQLIHPALQQTATQYCQAIILQLKTNFKKH